MALADGIVERADTPRKRRFGRAERDFVALGVAIASIILFVGTGGSVMPKIVHSWMGFGAGPDVIAANALLLNIALLIFGWRRYVDLTKEIRVREIAEEKARRLAETDALTGLLNRRSIGTAATELIRVARETRSDIAVLLLGLDNFKQVNEIYGHEKGDAVLIKAADRLAGLIPPGSALARMGSDEFIAVIRFEMRDQELIDRLAAKMIEAMLQQIKTEDCSVKLSLSIGLSRTHDADETSNVLNKPELCYHSLLRQADIALSQAKRKGRNRYAWFEAPMENELRFRNQLESGIRRGVEAGEFVPFYEQQIDIETGDLVGFEMLARWKSPDLGLVSPDIFVPIAEEIDLISEMSENLVRQAFKDAKRWHSSLTLSINVSPVQLREPWFTQKLLRLLVETGFPSNRLDVEITESSLNENFDVVRTVMTSLKNQGVNITLDDFGTGYSSLAQLRSLPFDRLKIDRSFVSELTKEGANSQVVEAIVSLARGLGLPITVEGVENSSVLELLRTLGNLNGQGYLYGRPEDAAQTLARLAKKGLLVSAEKANSGEQPSEPPSGNADDRPVNAMEPSRLAAN